MYVSCYSGDIKYVCGCVLAVSLSWTAWWSFVSQTTTFWLTRLDVTSAAVLTTATSWCVDKRCWNQRQLNVIYHNVDKNARRKTFSDATICIY